MIEIGVLGAGSWASALSMVLSDNNYKVNLWYHDKNFNKNIKKFKYLQNILIPKNISFSSNINDFTDNKILLIALPSHVIIKVLNKIKINKNTIIVNCSKGFDVVEKQRLSISISQKLGINLNKILVLSGPSHAEEVSKKIPTALVIASSSVENSKLIQKILSNNYFRVYRNSDIIGVEIGGACKNIISIASGICIGLGYGDNTISALISRGLQEIIRFGKFFGAKEKTFYGLSGLGDLSVTAFSDFSRNRQFGIKIGQGTNYKKAIEEIKMVVEGVNTTKIIYQLSKKQKINMPIVKEVYSILFENKKPRLAINELMERELISEINN